MRYIKSVFVIILALCTLISLAACEEEEKEIITNIRPIDCPESVWTADGHDFSFSVSWDGKVEKGTMLDKDGKTVAVSVSFTSALEGYCSVTSPDGADVYFLGDCEYYRNKFKMTVMDVYNDRFDNVPPYYIFIKS